jgi:hypothetical protein
MRIRLKLLSSLPVLLGWLAAAVLTVSSLQAAGQEDYFLLQHPALNETQIVFVFGGDV